MAANKTSDTKNKAETAKAEEIKTETRVEKKEEERVAIMIPLVEGEDTQQSVTINGEITVIPKGRTVYVKRPVAKVLENANKQMMSAWQNEQKFKNQRTDL